MKSPQRRPARARAGSSIVELMISLGVAAIVLTSVSIAATRARGLISQNEQSLQLDTLHSRVALKVTRTLLSTSAASVTPDLTPVDGLPTPWSDTLDFRSMEDWADGGIEWSPTQTLRWERDPAEVDNGVDDDGDGLIDEGLLVWIQDEGDADERRVVLATSVAELLEGEVDNGVDDNGNGLVDERGACFDVDGGLLTLRLTLERAVRGGQFVQRTRTTRVQLRND